MDAIREIKHRKLFLTEDPNTEQSPHRPELRIWADEEGFAGAAPVVTLAIGPLFGAAHRYVEMTPDEARTLAALLQQAAGDIDSVRENANELAVRKAMHIE